MKNILVIGATGQIGSELTLELRKRYGNDHVVAGYIPSAMPQGELKSSGPSAIADVTDRQSIEVVVRQFKVDTIYNLAALLSVVAESRPAMAWKIGIDGLWNVLEVALTLMLAGWHFIPQHLNTAFIPLVMSLWLRSGYGVYRKIWNIGYEKY